MRQSQILGLARIVALPVVVSSLFLAGCDSGAPSEKERTVLTAADHKTAFEKKLATFRQKADAGDPIAQIEMGRAYEVGMAWAVKLPGDTIASKQKDPFIDLDKAADWYGKAAMRGNAEAQYRLGMLWLPSETDESLGSPQQRPRDTAKAAEWFEKAVKQKHAEAAYELTLLYRLGKGVKQDKQASFQYFLVAAEQEHAGAQNQLGHQYASGEGVPKDDVQAYVWWRKSAEHGDAEAQNSVGVSYSTGLGAPKDAAKAAEWFLKSAIQGEQVGQSNLARLYGSGNGVNLDMVLAYAWFNLAAANPQGNEYLAEDAKKWRVQVEEALLPAEISEAQRISSSWKTGQILARESSSAGGGIKSTGKLQKTGTGTLFVVGKAGQAITNQHVVQGCAELRIEGREGVAKLTTEDKINDLALIQIPGKVNATATIAAKPESLRQGEDIVVFGFPLNAVLSSGGNLTPGVVSALTGLGNNTNQLQITAPIQPGSSGSPVLNKKGEVVGVVNMKLSDSKMARATGEIGQNVNFAISGQTLKAFLDKHKADYRDGAGFFAWEKDTADLAEDARRWTLVVECWK